MAPLFFTFDQNVYMELIPHHLSEVNSYPIEILECFERGGFSVSITGTAWANVALDEAHEMLINKDLKSAVIRPTTEYLQKTFIYRMKCYKNFIRQIFGEKDLPVNIMVNAQDIKDNENSDKMWQFLQKFDMFTDNEKELKNIFTNHIANPQQRHDILAFYDIGCKFYTEYVTHRVLSLPSSNAPVRKQRLLTLAPSKVVSKRKLNKKEKELKDVSKYLMRRLDWCRATGEPYDLNEQYSVYPRAFCDNNEVPHSGTKSLWLHKLTSRYLSSIVTNSLPNNWSPETVIIDAMFLINTRPLRRNTTIATYSQFLFHCFVSPHYIAGSSEVHLVFDEDTKQQFDIKSFERRKRDSKEKSSYHTCINFQPETANPTKWQDYLTCRTCKRSIIEAIGLSLLRSRLTRDSQVLVLAGCFCGSEEDTPVITTGDSLPQPLPSFTTNAEEAALIIWKHVKECSSVKILIYSPDSDVCNIGLGLFEELHKDIVIQLNQYHKTTSSFIFFN